MNNPLFQSGTEWVTSYRRTIRVQCVSTPTSDRRKETIMEDLIKRSEFIKALHKYFSNGFDSDEWWNSTHVLFALNSVPSADRPQVNPDLAKDFLKRQYEAVLEENRRLIADKSQGEWIPCSERVPIEYRTVLVTWEYAGKSYTTTAFRETKNAVTYWASNEQPKYTPLKVVAWMPLPKPWKGADDE